MGRVASFYCRVTCGKTRQTEEQQLSDAIKRGDIESVRRILELTEIVLCPAKNALISPKFNPLQFAALLGKVDVLTVLLEMGAEVNARNANGQTPLMSACKGGSDFCVEQLLRNGADALAFDRIGGRTCLHIACRLGHHGCVVKILEAVENGPINATWGFTRFVNIRDNNGAMPLHMAARAGHVDIVRLLLNSGALISAVTSNSTYGPGLGSSPLHCAAKSGSLNCVEELLAWGADRNRKDIMGNTPYMIAAHRGHSECAAILDPTAAEPLVWPSPLKFMQELEPETLSLLQDALAQANRVRNAPEIQCKETKPFRITAGFCFGNFKNARFSSDRVGDSVQQSSSIQLEDMDSGCYTCCICFESCYKMIEVDICGHQMCAQCTIALCCLSKPKSPSPRTRTPSCPFCRQDIGRLKLAKEPCVESTNLVCNGSKYSTGSKSWCRNSKRLEKILLPPL